MLLTPLLNFIFCSIFLAPMAQAGENPRGSFVETTSRKTLPPLEAGLRWQLQSIANEGPQLQKFVVVESGVRSLRSYYAAAGSTLGPADRQLRAEAAERALALRSSQLMVSDQQFELRELLRYDLGYSRSQAIVLAQTLLENPKKDLGQVLFDYEGLLQNEGRRSALMGEAANYLQVEINKAAFAQANLAGEIRGLLAGSITDSEKVSKIQRRLQRLLYYEPLQAKMFAEALLKGEFAGYTVAEAISEFNNFYDTVQKTETESVRRSLVRSHQMRRAAKNGVSIPAAVNRAGKR